MNKAIITTLMVIVMSVPLYFDNTLYSCFDLTKITVLYLLVFLATSLWCVKTVMRRGRLRFNMPQLGVPVMVVLGCTALSTIFSVSPYMSLVGTHKRYGGLISVVVYALLFFLVVRFVRKKHVEAFITVIIVTAVLAAVFGLSALWELTNIFKWSTDHEHRIASTFGHPAFFSAFLAMGVPLVLYRLLSGGKMWIYLPILTVMLFALYETKTRASFVGLLVSLLVFGCLAGRRIFAQKKLQVIGLIVVFGVIGVGFSIGSRFTGAYKDGHLSGTAENRVFQYKTACRIIRDYPVLGIGPDTLGLIYPRYFIGRPGIPFENQNRIHNETLEIAVSTGLLGLAAYVLLFFAWLRMVLVSFLRSSAGGHTLLAGLTSGIVAYLVQNQFSFGHVPIITVFWVMVGLSVVISNRSGYNGEA